MAAPVVNIQERRQKKFWECFTLREGVALHLVEFLYSFILIFIHSFIHSDHFYSASSSPLLLRGAPDYSTDTVSEFHAEAHRQL